MTVMFIFFLFAFLGSVASFANINPEDLIVLICTSVNSDMRGQNCQALAQSDGIVPIPKDKHFMTVFALPRR